MIFCRVLPSPLIVMPLPELPDVCEKSIVALFLPEILTPAGSTILSDFTVPSMTIVVPLFALLTASASVVPPFLTVIVFPDGVVVPDDELPEEVLQEIVPLSSTSILYMLITLFDE